MALVSKIRYTDLIGINRIDGEYFDPKYLELQKVIERNVTVSITKLVHVSDGNHMSISEYFTDSKEMPCYFRGQDINGFFLENVEPYRISKEAFCKGWMLRSHFYPGDVLLSIVGTVGSLSIVPSHITESTGSCKIAILRPKTHVKGEFIAAFLLSRYGQFQIKRNVRGAVQTGLILKDIGLIKIPLLDENHQKDIAAKIQLSIEKNRLSKSLYAQATKLLDRELGLDKIDLAYQRSFVSNVSAVIHEKRMNAEFFFPHIKRILEHPLIYDSKPLGAVFKVIRGITPDNYINIGFPVIKTKNIRVPEIDVDRISDFVESTKNLITINENDLLLASMGVGSLGRMSFIQNLDNEFIVDSTIRVLRKRPSIPSNYEIPTLLFLTSKVGQELIYRGIVGSTGIISLPDDYLKRIPIPNFQLELCDKLTELVKESMKCRQESKRLLEQAKTELETLIEQAAQAS